MFQDDNTIAHRASVVKDWKENHQINVVLPWPAQNPDLNPIENLWSTLERKIGLRKKKPENSLWRCNKSNTTLILDI